VCMCAYVTNTCSIDGVVIASPTTLHSAQIQYALSHGKHVMTEKPVTDNVKDTIDCYDVADKHKRHLFCAFTKLVCFYFKL
jgi:predicted dehydrogenase